MKSLLLAICISILCLGKKEFTETKDFPNCKVNYSEDVSFSNEEVLALTADGTKPNFDLSGFRCGDDVHGEVLTKIAVMEIALSDCKYISGVDWICTYGDDDCFNYIEIYDENMVIYTSYDVEKLINAVRGTSFEFIE